ncbi:MAG: carbohydrate ABC transporter permease [Clostridiales bacterium]|jgi:multiple sugar transport system permease protein|nr:carbohydrate ABC transporter permease [Clostridiales bacterium]
MRASDAALGGMGGGTVGGHARGRAAEIAFTALFAAIGAATVLPFFWMLSVSFKTPMEIMSAPEKLLPAGFYLGNFGTVLSPRYGFLRMYLNSAKITGINVAGSALTSMLAGYAFARLRFKGRDAIFLIYLATLMIPPQITMIPRYILFDRIGLIDTHLSLILTGMFSVIGVFMMRQYFMQLPGELGEAAAIDGAGMYRTFFQIYAPLAKPAIVTVIIINFTWQWNDYENPLIFLRRQSLFTIPLGLVAFVDANETHMELTAAAAVLGSFPMLALFVAAQKYFVNGLVAGAVKG